MMMYADAAGKCGLPGEWKEDAWFGASNSSIYNGGGGSSSVSNGGEGVECTTNEACQSGLFCASECFSGNGCPKNQMATALAGYCQPCHECHGDFDAFTGYCTDYCSSHGSSVDNGGTTHAAGSTDGTANATASSGDDSGSFVGSATCPEEYYKTACEPAAECFDHAMGCNAADGSFWFPDHCAEAAAVCAPCFPNSACEDAGYMSPDYNYPDDYNATTATGPDTDAAMPDMSGIDVGAPYNYNYDYDSIPDGSAGNAPTAVDGAGTPDAADGS